MTTLFFHFLSFLIVRFSRKQSKRILWRERTTRGDVTEDNGSQLHILTTALGCFVNIWENCTFRDSFMSILDDEHTRLIRQSKGKINSMWAFDIENFFRILHTVSGRIFETIIPNCHLQKVIKIAIYDLTVHFLPILLTLLSFL